MLGENVIGINTKLADAIHLCQCVIFTTCVRSACVELGLIWTPVACVLQDIESISEQHSDGEENT